MGALLRPFMKWPGNKYQILHHILQRLPAGRRLVEPFAGSCALSLNAPFDSHLVCDINADLIHMYQSLVAQPDAFIEDVRALFCPENNQGETYYHFRNKFNETEDPYERALLLIYLNRHGYNGLMRFNQKGKFNVPFGRYTKPYFPEKELRAFVERLSRAEFLVLNFEDVEELVQPGDVCYMDPPYLPLSSTSNFTTYATNGFSFVQQEKLARLCERLARKGIPVLLSNHHTTEARELYSASDMQLIQVQRFISRDGNNRNKVEEVLALFTGETVSGQGGEPGGQRGAAW
ncbi:Dam family site-specific DNA-(adenine-N6)-methyltransferase [Heliobacillus mobilis]|uniref:Site-specific DNA-methyltransferase (adenine-specific) n=1 Tax=Heliobacterium mobile TaxID=28064 RepID=A0A6I3SPI4_HELMO|nr:Dam family site-specific DNA-(adenine-N6)-methyltransferase [Heliobacterium mobile]MTV50422.1 Dam family site-specific DNA-(adenine-N6)-methyltransferase [Heliobacterium mobile]